MLFSIELAIFLFPVSKMTLALVLLGCCAAAVAIYLAAEVIHGRAESILLVWIFLFPLGYYFLSFPSDRPLFTLDRAVLGLIVMAMLWAGRRAVRPIGRTMEQAGLVWAMFILASCISLYQIGNLLSGLKVLVDTFVLPAFLGLFMIRYFPVRQYMTTLHLLTCGMVGYVAAIGLAELILHRDLLPFPGVELITDETGSFLRVNGPFSTNNSFGLVGLISLMFLLFCGRVLRERMTGWQHVVHIFGLAASLCIALLPMFRSIALTLLLVTLLHSYLEKRIGARIGAAVILLAAMIGMAWLQATAPEFIAKRVRDPADVYARLAQYNQTLTLFLAHPLTGIGLGNYIESASNLPEIYYHGVSSVGSAHNTLATVLAETGLSGTLPYVISQIFFFQAIWALRRRGTRDGVLCSTYFLFVFLAYWITGLTLTSGCYSDLNLWYVFVATTVYKFGITDPLHLNVQRLRERGTFVALERPVYEQI